MDTINERGGFLCNYEVLAILKKQREERSDQIGVLRTIKETRVAKENRFAFAREVEDEQIDRLQSSDLATVTFEAIQYLENKVQPMRQQTALGIDTLLEGLNEEYLNKAEILQIVNLAPTTLVEMVVCVEDFEARFPEGRDREAVMTLVQNTLVADHEVKDDENPVYEVTETYDDEEEEEEEDIVDLGDGDEGYEDDELVQEGLAGEGEAQGRELDEP